jgi:hypothetical protein
VLTWTSREATFRGVDIHPHEPPADDFFKRYDRYGLKKPQNGTFLEIEQRIQMFFLEME